jgi:hypothetical protein
MCNLKFLNDIRHEPSNHHECERLALTWVRFSLDSVWIAHRPRTEWMARRGRPETGSVNGTYAPFATSSVVLRTKIGYSGNFPNGDEVLRPQIRPALASADSRRERLLHR